MADVRISQLPAATTPLAGNEEVPLVQGGTTKKTTVDDIAAAAGAVTSVTGTAPVVSSGGATPAISMAAASAGTDGYLTSTDWNTFNNKQPAGSYLTSGGALGTPSSGTATNLTGLPLTTGVTGILPVANGGNGTATPALTAGTNVTLSGTWPNYTINASGGAGGGDVTGPASSTDNAIARYDGTTGKLLQNSSMTISDGGEIAGINDAAFNTAPATIPTAPGSLYWDAADNSQTLSLVMAGGNAVQQIGEEIYYRIKASSAITNGQCVMFTGAVGASGGITGAPASGLTDANGDHVMGVATEDIALNGWGYVTEFGLVRNIDTTGTSVGETWADGDLLYYNPSYSGGLTKTVPVAPAAIVEVATVVHAHVSSGSLFVRVTLFPRLNQLANVYAPSPNDNDLINWNTSNSRWQTTAVKTVNSTSLLGSGNVAVQDVLVSGTNIKTINSTSLLGSGDIATGDVTLAGTQTLTNKTIDYSNNTLTGVQPTLVSGTSIKTVNSTSLLGSGDIATGDVTLAGTQTLTNKTIDYSNNTLTGVQPTLVSGTSIKTINSTSLLGSGDITTGDVTLNGTQTLTNKTITNLIFDGSYTEEVYTLGTSGTIALDPANGTIQTCAASATVTFTDSLAAGQSIVLMLTNGATYTINWPTTTWVTSAGNAAPTLTAADTVVFWKISTTLYAAYVGSYV